MEVKTRDDYLGLVESSLSKNYDSCGGEGLKSNDINDAAVDAEYSVFTSNKVWNVRNVKIPTCDWPVGAKSTFSLVEHYKIVQL